MARVGSTAGRTAGPTSNEKEVAEAIDYAVERGVNHFDNADVYGNGRAERLLARILGPRTKDVIIATKVGHFPGTAEHAYEPQHIRHQCEQSLKNLGRDVIDIYYFHHGDFGEDDRYLDQATRVMEDLKRSGKIRLIGLSAYSSNDFVRLIPKIQPDVLQSWANALDTQFIDPGSLVRTIMDQRNLSFVAFSPLAQGLLLGRYKPGQKVQFEEGDHRKGSDRFEDKNLEQLQPKMDQLMARFGSGTDALARVALQYVLSFPIVGCVIPGFRNKKQVAINLSGADDPLSDDDARFVRAIVTEPHTEPPPRRSPRSLRSLLGRSKLLKRVWWAARGSSPRPPD